MSWFLAPALATLRSEIDAKYPTRDRTSDGTIGDAAHRARKSDHNPDPDGEVRALDVDRDIAKGFVARDLAERIVASRDPRISYIISKGQIVSGPDGPKPWQWRPYNGINGHFEHAHFSVRKGKALSGNGKAWLWMVPPEAEAFPKSVTPAKPKGDVAKAVQVPALVRPVLKLGDAGKDVEYLQRMLGGLTIDGDFGPATLARVRRYQTISGLRVTGATDPEFWHHLED